MQLQKIHLKNFRCFDNLTLDIDSPIILIEGDNGSGKTSILEALSYLSFLRSFRTHITKDMISDNKDNFFIKASFFNYESNEIQIGFSNKKRLIKLNGNLINKHKDLLNSYRPITLTEDDLDLIQGSPETRRSFIDQCILLNDLQVLDIFKKYKQVLERRNALLFKGFIKRDEFDLWTESLWKYAKIIQELRISTLELIKDQLKELLLKHFPDIKVNFEYEPKIWLNQNSFEDFKSQNTNLYNHEQNARRSLFGIHLDDFVIKLFDRKTKSFASRGQQKLLVLLIKISVIELLKAKGFKQSLVFLLDDFMTDFDNKKLEILIDLLSLLEIQLIFTSPTFDNPLKNLLIAKNAHIVYLNK